LHPTWSAVGIEASFAGDTNENGTASFVWRKKGEANWRNGVDMTIDRKRHLLWASIWPLEQGEAIEVQITFQDADGGEIAPVTGETTTRKMVLQNSGGNVYYVSPSGDDANPGSQDKPFKTLAFASSKLKAGDTLNVMTGVYREANLFKFLKGTPDKPIIITAAEGQKPIIDGAMTIEMNSGVWKQHQGNIYVAPLIMAKPPLNAYAAQDGKRMYLYGSVEDLAADKFKTGRAWFFDKKFRKIYVLVPEGDSPEKHFYEVAAAEYGLQMQMSDSVVVKGFEIRNFATSGVEISAGSKNVVVIDNVIHHSMLGVSMRGGGTDDNAVWRNEIFDAGMGDFSWDAIKRSGSGRQGVNMTYAGRGNSFCYNKVHGWFDCIVALSWKMPKQIEIHRDTDIMYNDLFNAGDDAIEADGGGVNMRIHGNRICNAHTAISLAPIERGPCYVTRNDATFHTLLFKLSVGGCTSHGWTYCYHNSGYALDSGNEATMIRFTTGIPLTNKVFKNNAMIGSEYSVRDGSPANPMDYNCYFNTPNTGLRRFHFKGERYEYLEDFQLATGMETHGMYADPQFVATPDLGLYKENEAPPLTDTSVGDMRLKPTSPCIDKGAVIRGVNEDFKGQAPDIGAYEFSQ
jgi:hypothetical protein